MLIKFLPTFAPFLFSQSTVRRGHILPPWTRVSFVYICNKGRSLSLPFFLPNSLSPSRCAHAPAFPAGLSQVFSSFGEHHRFPRPRTSRGCESVFWDEAQAAVCCESSPRDSAASKHRCLGSIPDQLTQNLQGSRPGRFVLWKSSPKLTWIHTKKWELLSLADRHPHHPKEYIGTKQSILNEYSNIDRLQPCPQITSYWLSSLDKC